MPSKKVVHSNPLEASPATVAKGEKRRFGGRRWGRRLRWPAGRREVAETTCLLLAGGVGSRFSPRGSRSRFPVDEATAAAATWNKSSRVLSRPVGAPLRYRRRARGGRSPYVESLYRSSPTVARCLRGMAGSSAFCFRGAEVAARFVEDWWLVRARGSCGGSCRRQRALFQDPGCSGRGPGRWASRRRPHLVLWDECPLRLLQSIRAMEHSPIWCGAAAGAGNPPRRGSPASSACKGVRGPGCNFCFLMDLCAIWDGQLYSVSLYGLPVSVRFP